MKKCEICGAFLDACEMCTCTDDKARDNRKQNEKILLIIENNVHLKSMYEMIRDRT